MQPIVSHISVAPWGDKASLLGLPKVSPLGAWEPERSAGGRVAERLLSLFTSSAVRKGSFEKMQFRHCRLDLLRAIDRCVQAHRPVQLTLMAFPFKAPNPAKVGARCMPDLAELSALVRLHQLQLKATSVYPPGLQIHVIHDGSYIGAVFGVSMEEVRGYERYFARLVDLVNALGPERFIHVHDFQTLLHARSKPSQQASCARESKRYWRRNAHEGREWADRFSKTVGMINLRNLSLGEACRLLDHAESGWLPAEYSDLDRRVRVAMLRYYVRDFLLHELDPRPVCFPNAIHATTQCRPRRLAIWMVDRGRSLLPWHGVGVIDRAGNWKVALAREVLGNQSYRPVFMDGEDTPFFYRQVT